MEINDKRNMNQDKEEYSINQDNDLFNAIRMGNSAIEPVIEDWMEIYQTSTRNQNQKEAISQLINFFLRSCGSNSSIDSDNVLDLDSVTDQLDQIQEEFKIIAHQTYPLIDKSAKLVSKNFRKNLIISINHLISMANSNSVLYDHVFLNSVQSYLVSMSSSTLRSFRHTSTVIVLFGFINSICHALVSSKKELVTLTRKVQSESSKSISSNKRDQLLEWKSRKKQVQNQTDSLENFINEFVDGVFVHRYRDADPNIRADCVQALGHWMTIIPEYFLEGNYLRYIGWVLTDNNKDVRHEALKALNTLYSKEENFGAMQQFTTRFQSRLIEMATRESDLMTRSVSINIVTHIDRHGLLDSHQRNQLGRLIYHQDRRVRKAISGFFNNLFEEDLDARKLRLDAATHGNRPKKISRDDELEKQIAFKCLAHLLLKLEKDSKRDRTSGEASDVESNISEDETVERNSNDDDELIGEKNLNQIGSSSLIYHNEDLFENGRVDFAIEDLWNQVKILHDWQSLCNYLLLDHTASTNRLQPAKSTVRGAVDLTQNAVVEDDSQSPSQEKDINTNVYEACKLSEAEETILIEVLVASLKKFSSSPTTAESLKIKKKKKRKRKDGEEMEDEEAGMETEDELNRKIEDVIDDNELENKIELTRIMINLLPKLWSKFSTDPLILTEVFRIPKLMSLNMYLDLRMVSAYEDMWDTMIKHYLKQQHLGAIQVISSTIAYVSRETKSLQHINQTKILKLHHALISSLKDLTDQKSNLLDHVTLEEVEIVSLKLLLIKISNLFRQIDLSDVFKFPHQHLTHPIPDSENSPYHLINAIANRGRLAHAKEAKLVEVALEILQLNFTWTGASVCHSTSIHEPLSLNNNDDPSSLNNLQPPPPILQENLPNPPPDSTELRSYARIIRDNLVNLCSQFLHASDTAVNESVKRAAFIHLLNTYLLCQGALIPEDLRTECDDETQIRCASFVETQILKFIIDSHTETQPPGEHQHGENDNQSDDAQVLNNNRLQKGKKIEIVPSSKTRTPSLEELRRVEEFNLLITTFAKSIRCGLIHLQHSAVILQHFTRFSKIFDISAELLIATLNDSISIYPNEVESVVKCLTQAFKASFELYLNAAEYTEDQFIRVCRLLQSVFIIRGAKMSFKPRLDSTCSLNFHLDCIKWLIDKATEPGIEPEFIDKLGAFFRGLGLLSLGLDGRSCLKVKTELERLFSEREFSTPTSKSWDPYQQHYLKRLITVMAKDPSIKRAAKLALQQQGITEDSIGEQIGEGSKQPRPAKKKKADRRPKATPKSEPRRGRKSTKRKNGEDHDEDYQSTAVVRPEAQPRPKRLAHARAFNSPPASSHMASPATSYSHLASPAVSVLIPIGPKRKISESSSRQNAEKTGKRARVDAVVIGKLKDLRPDGGRSSRKTQGKNSRLKTPSRSDPTTTSTSSIHQEDSEGEDNSPEEEGDDNDNEEEEEEEEEQLTPKPFKLNPPLGHHDLNQLPSHSSGSPNESELSLAQIKRKSRLKI